jgi:hypothetical protein
VPQVSSSNTVARGGSSRMSSDDDDTPGRASIYWDGRGGEDMSPATEEYETSQPGQPRATATAPRQQPRTNAAPQATQSQTLRRQQTTRPNVARQAEPSPPPPPTREGMKWGEDQQPKPESKRTMTWGMTTEKPAMVGSEPGRSSQQVGQPQAATTAPAPQGQTAQDAGQKKFQWGRSE